MKVRMTKEGKIEVSDFSPVQAYKIAGRMEADGIAYYRDLLKDVKDAAARRDIEFMIGQEEEHRRTFEELLAREKEAADDSFEEDDIVNYVGSRVFASAPGGAAEEIKHRHTAFAEALNREKRSIVFYEGCLGQATDEKAAGAFKKIIGEEEKHLLKFAELLRTRCIQSKDGCAL